MTDYHYVRTLRTYATNDPDRRLIATPTTTRTAAELFDDVLRLAAHLSAHGIGEGDAVALMMSNSLEVVESFYAALAIGAAPANVNMRYGATEIAYIIDNCRASALLYESSVAGAVREAAALLTHPVALIEVDGGLWPQVMAGPVPELTREPSATDRVLIYTGGTTGMPRAVEWEVSEHYQMIWQMVRPDKPAPDPQGLIDAGRYAPTALPCSPFVHGVGLALSMNTLNGGGLLVMPGHRSFDAAMVLGLVERWGVAVLGIVGDAFARPLLAELQTGDWTGRVGTLRAISSAGAVLSTEVRAGILAVLPDLTLVSNFGSTEALVTRDMDTTSVFTPERPVAIVDPTGRPVPAGAVGLLATSGNLPLGYLGDPDRTARTFPTIDGQRFAVTGDEAILEPDGRVRVLGRGSSVINTGGEKVWPEEVENVLRAHPEVVDVVVVGRPDERWGQRVTAVVRWQPGAHHDEGELELRCRDALAAYKCPKAWLALEDIPRTHVGKPDFPAIQALLDEHEATPAPS